MPTIETKYFGAMTYEENSCFDFPWGLPAFEKEQRFLPLEMPGHQPLVFLQSVGSPGLCFIALPVLAADQNYKLAIAADDLRALGLASTAQPRVGAEVLVLALLTIHENAPPTANLLAPVVVNLANSRALQAIRQDNIYTHAQPLGCLDEEAAC